ncbi:Beta-1,3-galactosyltransferase 1 [Holothuria leucospilota]|uniref:Hexosyltransferase n=1 Tax=Holothuria leucospilota TaxID=206669 RepID=A0A9Q1HCK1_HOLLE|nr:Beta-1,3-galactosyltransferase 1 [Holothuria leucospilota]
MQKNDKYFKREQKLSKTSVLPASDVKKLKQRWAELIAAKTATLDIRNSSEFDHRYNSANISQQNIETKEPPHPAVTEGESSENDGMIYRENTVVYGILNYTTWISRDDPHEYPYIINPRGKCANGEDGFKKLTLLILVVSKPRNFKQREVIRKTWAAQPAHFASSVIITVFLLGRGPIREMTQFNVEKEAQKFEDIVQEDFVDSYLNLTVKTIMGLKWVTKFCPRARFVLKIDDDMSLNIDRLLAYLRRSPMKNFFGGKAAESFPVLRDTREKFYVPWSLYPEEKYPPYCVGLGYVMSTDLVYKLYYRALTTPLFPWEDVYMGMLLKFYAIMPTNIPNFFGEGNYFHQNGTLKMTNTNISKVRAVFTLHGLSWYEQAQVWSLWSGKPYEYRIEKNI